ncbi:hypothetical protein AAHC03_021101 [Spirometra sp. Aus1]
MVRYWLHRSKAIQKRIEPHIQKFFPFHKPELDGVSPVAATYSGKVVKAPFDLAIGMVVPFGQSLMASRENIVKVRLHKLCLNKFLLKDIKVDIGDIVLVEKCDPPIAFNTVYKLKRVVYPVGNITDPVTGLKCEGPEYSIEVMQEWLKNYKKTVEPAQSE